jgi:hypothetical protein
MTSYLFTFVAVVLGILAFVLILLGLGVDMGWVTTTITDGQTASELALYGVISAAASVGSYYLAQE